MCSSWKESVAPSLRALHMAGRAGPTRHGWALLNHVVDQISVPRCLVLVAFSPAADDDPEILHAWVAVAGPRLVYGYTKPKYRGMGLHRQLREEAPNATWLGYDVVLELEQVRSVA